MSAFVPTARLRATNVVSSRGRDWHRCLLSAACILVAAMSSVPAAAQDWPKGPIIFAVPFSVGGGGDILGRLYGNKLAGVLSVPLVYENKVGAGGNIGSASAAKAAPDGNTLLFGTLGTMGTNQALYKKPGFSIDDFDPVAVFGTTPAVLVVSKDSPFRNVAELVAHAKAHPKQLTCASGGNGTLSHVACAMLQQMAQIEVEHVPYRGTSAGFIDMRSGSVSFIMDIAPTVMPQVKGGAFRAIAVTSPKRVPTLPEIPTMSESGVPGYELVTWDGLFAPKGTPPERLDKLHAAVSTVTSEPEFKRQMLERGTLLEAMPRKAFADLVRREHQRMGAIVKQIGLTLD